MLTVVKGEEVTFVGLGTFRMEVKRSRRLLFTPSSFFYKYLNRKEVASKYTPSEIERAILAKLAAEEDTKDPTEAIEHPFGPVASSAFEYNQLKQSLLRYLQQEYPLGNSWTHPVSKEVFEAATIRRALFIYKELDPDGYLVLWCLWLNIQNRRALAERLGLEAMSLRLRWIRATDSLLFILLNPDLEPPTLNDFLRYKYEPRRS